MPKPKSLSVPRREPKPRSAGASTAEATRREALKLATLIFFLGVAMVVVSQRPPEPSPAAPLAPELSPAAQLAPPVAAHVKSMPNRTEPASGVSLAAVAASIHQNAPQVVAVAESDSETAGRTILGATATVWEFAMRMADRLLTAIAGPFLGAETGSSLILHDPSGGTSWLVDVLAATLLSVLALSLWGPFYASLKSRRASQVRVYALRRRRA